MNFNVTIGDLIAVVGLVITGANLYITNRIRLDILQMKLWVIENFAKKEDVGELRNIVQLHESARRTR